jgi:hypothetical protein
MESVHILALFEGLRKEILTRLEATPERDRRVVMGRNTELYQALIAIDILLLQARLLSHSKSSAIIRECWPLVRKLGVQLGYFEKLKGNREARRELRSFLMDFPAELELPQKKKTRRSARPTFQEEVANVLLPQQLESLRDPHLEDTRKALHPKTPENCTPAEWERARSKLR